MEKVKGYRPKNLSKTGTKRTLGIQWSFENQQSFADLHRNDPTVRVPYGFEAQLLKTSEIVKAEEAKELKLEPEVNLGGIKRLQALVEADPTTRIPYGAEDLIKNRPQ